MHHQRKTINKQDFVYGIHAVNEAIESGKEIEKILVQKNLKGEQSRALLQLLNERHLPYQKVPVERLNKVTRKNHQGVICFLSPVQYASLDHIVESCFSTAKDPFLLVLDRITDVRNFGAICRTAECAGIDAIVVPEKGAALLSSDAMKTSAGALNFIPVCRAKNIGQTMSWLKDSGLNVVACTEKTDKEIYDTPLSGPLAIVLGSEENGISDDLLERSSFKARIPMKGSIASLNVSASAAIIIYEALRQRQLT